MPTAIPIQTSSQRHVLKSLGALRVLALIQIILGFILIALEAIGDGVIAESEYISESWRLYYCTIGTGIWVGALGVISGALGLAAFRVNYGNRCFMTAHFVMSLLVAMADAVLITLVSLCLVMLPFAFNHYLPYYSNVSMELMPSGGVHTYRGLVTLESLLDIFGLFQMICSILSTAFICRNWCSGPSAKTITVVYLPQSNITGAMQDGEPISVPAGTQVVFIPAGRQQAVAH